MTKAEAIRWVRREIAMEIRSRLAEVPDRIGDAPDPEMVNKVWVEQTWIAADKIWPENKPL